MAIFNWAAIAPPKPAPPRYQGRDKRPYSTIAPHIRGRVYLLRPASRGHMALWGMEVINTSTGQVIASDNCTVLEKIEDLCHEATAVARATWFWSFRQKDVS